MATGKPRPAFVAQPSRLHAMGGHGCAGETPAPQSIQAGLCSAAVPAACDGWPTMCTRDAYTTTIRDALWSRGDPPHHKASRPAFVAQPSRLHAMGGQKSEINPNEGGYNKQGGIK